MSVRWLRRWQRKKPVLPAFTIIFDGTGVFLGAPLVDGSLFFDESPVVVPYPVVSFDIDLPCPVVSFETKIEVDDG